MTRGEAAVPLSEAHCNFVRELVRDSCGIVLEEGKDYLVESRLTALARREGFDSAEGLVSKCRGNPFCGIQARVVEAMTTNETSFFRDTQPFEALRKVVLPDLLQRRGNDRKLFIWCAAASSGQEPYSLAMLIREHFPKLADGNVRILATDLALEVLERARTGLYGQIEVNRGLSAQLLVKYFDRKGMQWQIKDDIRKMIDFRQMNLIQPWAPSMQTMDVVFLRNVLIYFDVPTKKSILAKVRRILRPDGYLFLGGAETTMNLDDTFVRVPADLSCCYRLRP
jgi:chemotaxis protein methyltransferase CheR